jgi:hypothetical protein
MEKGKNLIKMNIKDFSFSPAGSNNEGVVAKMNLNCSFVVDKKDFLEVMKVFSEGKNIHVVIK